MNKLLLLCGCLAVLTGCKSRQATPQATPAPMRLCQLDERDYLAKNRTDLLDMQQQFIAKKYDAADAYMQTGKVILSGYAREVEVQAGQSLPTDAPVEVRIQSTYEFFWVFGHALKECK